MRHRTPREPADSQSTASQSPSTDLKRRRFLLSLSAGGAGAAAAAVAALPGSVAAGTDAATEAVATGYRETEHVRDYYRTARI